MNIERILENTVRHLNEASNQDLGKRFNRLLRFGLSDGGTGDIPLTKRAFRDLEAAETNPILRKKVFSTVDRIFEYILTDEILYNRFLLLLHRNFIFGEEGYDSMDFETLMMETLQEAKIKNFIAQFSAPTHAKSFIQNLDEESNARVNWISRDGREIQIQCDGSQERMVNIAENFKGNIIPFEGDVRVGFEDDKQDLIEGLIKKSEKSNVSYDILAEVYLRGVNAYPENTKRTAHQWAYDRVNSFVAGGKAQKIDDKDLWEEHLSRLNEPMTEADNALINELGKVGKAVAAGVAYQLWKMKKDQKKLDDKNKKNTQVSSEKSITKKKKTWRDKIDWDKNESLDISDTDLFFMEHDNIDDRFNAFLNESLADSLKKEKEKQNQETQDVRDKHRTKLQDLRRADAEQREKARRKADELKRKELEKQQNEEAPPSSKMERFIKKNKAAFNKKYGENGEKILYATAWKMHNKNKEK